MAIRGVVLSWRLASLGIDDELLGRQELVGHLNGTLEIATRIVAQVDDKVLEALLLQVGQGDEQLGIGLLAEVLDLDITRVVVEHIGSSDRLRRNLSTRDVEGEHLGMTETLHADTHLGALRTLEAVHGLLLSDLLADELLAVDHHDFVAGNDARLLGRSVLDDVLHVDRVLTNGELDAHARERTLEIILGLLHVLGADIHRMRVELAEDQRHSLLHE